MVKTSLLGVLLVSALFFQACNKKHDDNADTKVAHKANSLVRTNEYILHDLNNTQYILEKTPQGVRLKNKSDTILLIDIFATWCPPCQASAQHLASLQKKYKNDILVLGLDVEDAITKEALQNFQSRFHANYALLDTSNDNRRLIDDIANKLKLGKNFGIPLLAIYKNGKLVRFYQGLVEEEFIESDIKRALEHL